MQQGHTGTSGAEGARKGDGIIELRSALFECGVGDDGHIAQHHEAVEAGERHDRGVSDDGTRGTQPVGLVENVAQEVVAVDQALHEHIALAVVHQLHGALHGVGGIGGRHALHFGAHLGRGGGEGGDIVLAHQEGMDKTEPHTFEHGLQGMGIGGTTHHDAHTATHSGEAVAQFGERTDGEGHGGNFIGGRETKTRSLRTEKHGRNDFFALQT